MPVAHSQFNTAPAHDDLCDLPLLPLKGKARGPAPSLDPSGA